MKIFYPFLAGLTMLAVVQPFLVSSVQAETIELAVCNTQSQKIRLYRQDNQLYMEAMQLKDGVIWLNTAAAAEMTPSGIMYRNIRGEQPVQVFIANPENSCSLTIGDQPSETGTIMAENITQAAVTGTVTYREKMALPPGSVVTVKLLDVSRQDAPAVLISSQTITTNEEQVPIPFSVSYDPSVIVESNRYVVRADITINEEPLFITTNAYPVLTQGNSNQVELVLTRMTDSSLSEYLKGTQWLLEDLGGKGVLDNVQTTLEFGEDNRLAGKGGCNRYFSSYTITDGNLTMGVIGSTQMACAEAIMNQELSYFQALEKAKAIRLEGSFLLIDVEGQEQPLRFTRYP